MSARNRSRLGWMVILGTLTVGFHQSSVHRTAAQESTVASQDDEAMAKFFQVLLRRPRPGTALDRVYGYHVQNGSLDDFIATLDVANEAEMAGSKQMILGLVQSQRGNPALAADAFAKAETLLADDAACSHLLGQSLLAIGQTENAARAFQRAIDRNPLRNEALPIFTDLGRLYSRAGQNEKALQVWKQLESLFPNDLRVGGQIASTLADDGNLEAALQRYEDLSRAPQQDDDQIAFAVQAAEIRRRLGQHEQCINALEKILGRLRPGSWMHSDIRSRIEDGFLKAGDYDALANYYITKQNAAPDDVTLRVRLGRVLVSARRLDEAITTLTEAVKLAPDDPEVRIALIDVLTTTGDRASAANQYQSLAAADPNNPDYLLRWGQLLLDDEQQPLASRRQAAAEIWNRLASVRGDDAVTLSQIADRMRDIENTDQAITLYKQAIDVDPNSPQYREYLGEYLYQLDRKEESIAVWQSIAADDRRSRDSLVRLAEVYGTFKEQDLALSAWREAAELDLSFPQELRFAQKLRDANLFDEAVMRLNTAEAIAETPDEHEQLLKDRIATYQQAGTLIEQISALKELPPTANQLRTIAMMHAAAGNLSDAQAAIQDAVTLQPDDPNVLLIAAELSERQSRYADAVDVFQKLARIDVRFRTHHLQRVADLQMRLGQADLAMETCQTLIDANPASPESYQFLARIAFQAGRDEQGFAALRRAMNVAPRDNAPRRMLATAFADRFRTAEAIELHWESMRYETEAEGRLGIVKVLAPLYDRKSEIDDLIRRINEMARDELDPRTAQLMISAAYEAVQDYGAARQAIDRLLVNQPHDVSLLETMVRLCDASADVEAAAEYQAQIVSLADTPENRFTWVQLQLDADIIDIKTALSDRAAFGSDPSSFGGMIHSAIRRGDRETAIAVCEEALKRDPSLWDVKLALAQLLLYESAYQEPTADDASTFPAAYQRAIKLAHEVRALDLPFETQPLSLITRRNDGSTRNTRSAGTTSEPRQWSSSFYTLARSYRLGQYQNYNISSQLSQYPTIDPLTFGHARVLAIAVEMVAIVKSDREGKSLDKIQSLITESVPLPAVESITDANLIWEYRALRSIAGYVVPAELSPRLHSDEEVTLTEQLNWRMADLDPKAGGADVRNMLMGIIRAELSSLDNANSKPVDTRRDPLMTEPQLVRLLELYDQAQTAAETDSSASSSSHWTTLADFRVILADHFRRVGDDDRAHDYELPAPADDATLPEIIRCLTYHLTMGQVERADALIDRMLPAARRGAANNASSGNSISGTAGQLFTVNPHGDAFVKRHRLKILDAVLAYAFHSQAAANPTASTLSDGTVSTYLAFGRGGQYSYYSIVVKSPLSTALLGQNAITELTSLFPSNEGSSQARNLELDHLVLDHLDRPLPDASPQEQKSRTVLAAFAYWWMKQPQQCAQRINDLCKQYPDDVDLRIEQARLASELGQTRFAMQMLDTFDPLDSAMLVRKEMAALNLASQLGDSDRAKLAAERLFGLRMDTKTQLALAEQLRRLGMPEKSAAVLRRLKGGRARDESIDLQIAQSFLESADKESAAEVAYTVLRRINSGRGTSSNASRYRQQAVSILRTAKRLDPIIQQAERRVQSSPTSFRARTELAELYAAAGKKADADAVWNEIAKIKPHDPQQLITRANVLYSARQYKESAALFLDAFERNPQLIDRHVYEMTRAVEQAGNSDEMFKRLTKLDPEAIQAYRFDTLINVGRRKAYTDAKRAFVAHAFKNTRFKQDFYRYISDIPAPDQEKIPEIRQAMMDALCNHQIFSGNATIWQVSRRSSGGTASGPLLDLMTMLRNDPQIRERFEENVASALDEKSLAPSAKFLIALLDTFDEDRRADAIRRIRELVSIPTDSNNTTASDEILISGGLLWQAGQVMESIEGLIDEPGLLVAVYEHAVRAQASDQSDFRFSVKARLVKALTHEGQTGQARQFLLDAYANTDHSADEVYNPGYGDSQDLQCYQSIAEELDALEFPIDALMIQQRMIASPERFEKAKRWGGSDLDLESTKVYAEKLRGKITPQVSAVYLVHVAESLSGQTKEPTIKLMEFPVDLMQKSAARPGLVIAIDAAANTEVGLNALETFDRALKSAAEALPNDWSITAARILVATKIHVDDLPSLHARLQRQIPGLDQIRSATDTANATTFLPLVDLFAILIAMSDSDDDRCREIGSTTASYLRVVAQTLRDPVLELSALAYGDQAETALAEYLDQIDQTSQSSGAVAKPQVDACLNIAMDAAKRGDLILSSRALSLALRMGPPLNLLTSGGDAFAIQKNANVQQHEPLDANGPLTEQLLSLLEHYSDATGTALVARTSVVKSADSQPEVAPEIWSALDNALRSIVLPDQLPSQVFPYAKRIALKSNYDNYSSNVDLSPQSVSIAMARVAKIAGTQESVLATIRSRFDSSADPKVLAGVWVDVALASGDNDALDEALKQMVVAFESVLPKPRETPAQPESLTSISVQTQLESYAKSDIVDVLIQALTPVAAAKDSVSKECQKSTMELLERTALLIESDSYTTSRHGEILRRLRSNVLAGTPNDQGMRPSMQANQGPFGPSDVSLLGAIASIFSTSQPPSAGTRLNNLIADGLFSKSASFVRTLIAQQVRDDFDSPLAARVCLESAKLAAAERYEFLLLLTLGSEPSDRVMHWGIMVPNDSSAGAFGSANSLSAAQSLSVSELQQLATCTADLPMVDTLLMLADVAVELGRSETLLQELRSRVQSPGDDADIAATLVAMAAMARDEKQDSDQWKPLVAALAAVAADLKQSNPRLTKKPLAFPDLALFLAARAVERNYTGPEVHQTLQELISHATHGNYDSVGSLVGRIADKAGVLPLP